MSLVEPLCFVAPLTLRRIDSFCGIGDLVARREKWSERREGVGTLALEALPAAIELEVTFREIDADAIAEHVVERLTLSDIDSRLADHHAEFDLPVDAFASRGMTRSSVGPHSALVAFRKSVGSFGIGRPVSSAWSR